MRVPPDVLYVQALASPLTVNTMPEATLKAFADHGALNSPVTSALNDWDEQLSLFCKAGVDIDALGEQLQSEGAESFDKSWKELLEAIDKKSEDLK
jgi:transaldolase